MRNSRKNDTSKKEERNSLEEKEKNKKPGKADIE